jgi:chromosome segregation ATPase
MTNSIDTLIRKVNERIPASVTPATRIEIHPCEWIELGDEITQLRGNLSLAEEGLANYALEVDDLKKCLDFAATGLGVVERRRDELKAEIERLRAALQKIACWDRPFAEQEEGYASMAIVTAREATKHLSDETLFRKATALEPCEPHG